MQKSYTTQTHLKKILTPIQQQKKIKFNHLFIQNLICQQTQLDYPNEELKKLTIQVLSMILDLFQQKQKLRQTLSNGTTLQTSELPDYIGVQTIMDEPEEKPKIESKIVSPSYNHYHNHTKQIVNLMKNAHQQLSPVIGRNNLEKNIINTLDFNQLSRLMKALYNPSKQPKTETVKKRTLSEKVSIKQSF